MKIVNELPQKSKYAKYLAVLEPGKAIVDLNYKTAEGLRQALYKKEYRATMIKQENGLYTVGMMFRRKKYEII